MKNLNDLLIEGFDHVNRNLAQGPDGGTGFPDLDRRLVRFEPGQVIVIAGRPCMGKTSLLLSLCNHLSASPPHVILFSFEQTRAELCERFLCAHTGLSMHKLRRGLINENERDALMKASSDLAEHYSMCIQTAEDLKGPTNVKSIDDCLLDIADKVAFDVVAFDYIHLIDAVVRRETRESEVADIMRWMKDLAMRIGVVVLLTAQCNRSCELREDKRPRLSDLRDSGAIEQDADVVLFLYRPDMYDPEDRPGEAELIIAKNRNGPVGTVRLGFRRECMRFEHFEPPPNPLENW